MLMLQLEMHQPVSDERHHQRLQRSTVVQPTGAPQPLTYVRSATVVPELYDSGQSKAAGIILIIAGVMLLVFHIIGIVSYREANALLYFDQGFESIMVSSCALWCFFDCKF